MVLNSRYQQELDQVIEEIRQRGHSAVGIVADLTDASEIQRLGAQTIEHFGAVHALVNNVGGVDRFSPFEELSDEEWIGAFQLNVLSAVRLVRAVLPAMKRQHWGRNRFRPREWMYSTRRRWRLLSNPSSNRKECGAK